jgi:large repetitive protein
MASNGGRFRILAAAVVVVALGGLLIWKLRDGGGNRPETRAGGPARPSIFAPDPDEERGDGGATVEGLVKDGEGRPIDGAILVLSRARSRDSVSFAPPRPSTTVTAGGGSYRFEKLAPGEYALTAMAQGWSPAERSPITLQAAGQQRIDLALRKGGIALAGRVHDAGGGVVPGATVRASSYAGRAIPLLFETKSDDSGAFRLSLAAGSYSLRAEAEGYAPGLDYLTLVHATSRDLRLMPAARILGRVVDRKTREPVPAADVWLVQERYFGGSPARDVKTDQDGNFAFNDIDPGSYAVAARKGALVGYSKMVAVAAAQTIIDVDVQVDPGLKVSGRVTAAGKGLAGVRVSLSKTDPPFDRPSMSKSQDDGSYQIDGVLPGRYGLYAHADGYARARKDAVKVLGKDVTGVDLALEPESVIAGVVLSRDGKPVDGASVEAMMSSRSERGGRMFTTRSMVSDAQGRFEIKELTPAEIRLHAKHPEHGGTSEGPFAIAAGEKRPVKLTLGNAGSIAGTVRYEDGSPAAGVRVTGFLPEPRQYATDTTAPDGSFRLLPLGKGEIDVAAAGGSSPDPAQRTKVVLSEGEQKAGVELKIARSDKVIRGQVLAADGRPVSGASVSAGLERGGRAFRGDSRSSRQFLSGDDGTFVIDELSAGTYTVWAFHSGYPDAEAKGVTAGSTVKLQFPAEATLAGVVVGQDGRPAGDYTIAIGPGSAGSETAQGRADRVLGGTFETPTRRVHDPAGAFEFARLKPGPYELKATTVGGQLGSLAVTVAAGEKKQGLRIVIAAGLRVTGKVVDADSGAALAGARLTTRASGEQIESITDAAGKFELVGLMPGEPAQIQIAGNPREQFISEGTEVQVPTGGNQVDIGTLRLMRAPDWEERFRTRGTQGFASTQRNGRVVVTQVWPRVEKLLKVGDVIVAVEGRDVRNLGPGAVRYLLARKPGSSSSFTVETPGGGTRTVTIEAAAQ